MWRKKLFKPVTLLIHIHAVYKNTHTHQSWWMQESAFSQSVTNSHCSRLYSAWLINTVLKSPVTFALLANKTILPHNLSASRHKGDECEIQQMLGLDFLGLCSYTTIDYLILAVSHIGVIIATYILVKKWPTGRRMKRSFTEERLDSIHCLDDADL